MGANAYDGWAQMDPLSDVLSILKPQSHRTGVLDLGHSCAIAFPDQAGALKCNAVISGRAWVTVEGSKQPVQLDAGDFFVLPTGRPFTIATDTSVSAEPVERYLSGPLSDRPAIVNGGGDTVIASCRFTVTKTHPSQLIALLPSIIVIPAEAAAATHLRHFVELILDELAQARPGGALIAQHLSHVVLVQTLRHHQTVKDGRLGWLAALADERLTAALTAIHEDPGRNWTLTCLAGRAGMSRSVFARRFRDVIGETPMEYLTVLRMIKASDQLLSSGNTISAVAATVGYQSENAFNTAFKRIMGSPPRQYVNKLKSLATT